MAAVENITHNKTAFLTLPKWILVSCGFYIFIRMYGDIQLLQQAKKCGLL